MENKPEPSRWAAAVGLAVLIFAAYLFIASSSTLFDRDEPRFARAAVEMVRSGNYLFPTFNGKLRPDKPILIYWLMSLPIRVLGMNEISVRFFSALGAAGAALLTYTIGRRLISERGGLIAMAMMATTPLLVLIGTAATSDGVLLFFLTACFALWARVLERGQILWSEVVLLSLAMGGGMLTKGPLGLAVPVLGMITSMAMLHFFPSPNGIPAAPGRGQGEGLSALSSPPSPKSQVPSQSEAPHPNPLPKKGEGVKIALAAFVGVVIFLVWAIPANKATDGQYAAMGFGKHVLGRMVSPMEGHGGSGMEYFLSLPFYIPVLIVGFFPWTLFLLGAIAVVWNGKVGGTRGRALLFGWAVPTFILMSLVATKLPHYIAPMWPVLALMIAGTLEAQRRGELSPKEQKLLHRGGILFAPVAIGAAALLGIGPWLLAAPALKLPGVIAAFGICVFTAWTLREHLQSRSASRVFALIGAMFIILLLVTTLVLPAFEKLKLAPRLADAIHANTASDISVVTCEFGEPSLNFYADRGRIETLNRAGAVEWAKQPGKSVLVIPRETQQQIEEKNGPLGAKEIIAINGFNYSNGRKMSVVVLKKD